jgi:hypothetical protein
MNVTCKFWNNSDGGFFVFAPCIYQASRDILSIGLELFGVRVFYICIRRS